MHERIAKPGRQSDATPNERGRVLREPAPGGRRARRLVLTIEDQPDIRRLIRMTLEFKGFDVLEAGSGELGLELLKSRRPDLILLDVMMPGIGGLSVGRMLGADPKLRTIPVVMLSALGSAGDVEAGLQTGVRAYLVKPFSPLDLLALVERLIDEAQKQVPADELGAAT
jgi:DNA-binding response OmpR family regulator